MTKLSLCSSACLALQIIPKLICCKSNRGTWIFTVQFLNKLVWHMQLVVSSWKQAESSRSCECEFALADQTLSQGGNKGLLSLPVPLVVLMKIITRLNNDWDSFASLFLLLQLSEFGIYLFNQSNPQHVWSRLFLTLAVPTTRRAPTQ